MKNKKKKKLFTKKEKEVTHLLIDAKGRATIGIDLNISISTVDTHIKNIHQKTHTSNTAGVIKYVHEHKLFDEDEN